MAGVSDELAREALTLAMHKLPFKTKIVTRDSENELYWFKRQKLEWTSSIIKREKGASFWIKS